MNRDSYAYAICECANNARNSVVSKRVLNNMKFKLPHRIAGVTSHKRLNKIADDIMKIIIKI